MYFIGDIFSSPALFSPHYFTSHHGSKCRSNKLVCLTIRFACCIFLLMRSKACLYTSLKCVFISLLCSFSWQRGKNIKCWCSVIFHHYHYDHNTTAWYTSTSIIHTYTYSLTFHSIPIEESINPREQSSKRTCMVNKRRKTTWSSVPISRKINVFKVRSYLSFSVQSFPPPPSHPLYWQWILLLLIPYQKTYFSLIITSIVPLWLGWI